MNITTGAVLLIVLGTSSIARAQTSSPPLSQGVTIMGGAFADERGAEGHRPFVSARYERWLSKLVAFEGGVTHARSTRTNPFNSRRASASYSSGDLGLQLQVPLGRIRPYVGATIGGTHFRNNSNDDREVGLTHALLVGARIGRFRNASLRTEFRLRRDDIASAVSYNGEYGLGLTYNF
jgi:hypothetical protein